MGFLRKFSILLSVLLWPGLTQALTVADVVSAVRENHPAIASAKHNAKASRSRVHAESWLPDPEVSFMAEEVPFSRGTDEADMLNYGVKQAIPFPTSLVTKAKSLRAQARANESFAVSVEREKIFEAKSAYFELYATRQKLSDQNAILNSLRQSLASQTATYAAQALLNSQAVREMNPPRRDITMTNPFDDVLMTKMRKAEVEAGIHDLRHQEQAVRAKLNLLMGRAAETPIATLATPPIKSLKFSAQELEAKLLQQNSNLSQMQWQEKRAKEEVSLAKQRLIPTITPEFEYNQRFQRENAYTVGVSLNVPIWLSRNASEIKTAKAEHYRAQADWQAEALQAKTDLYNLIYHARLHRQILTQYQNEILPIGKALVTTAAAAQSVQKGSAVDTYQKLINYQQASSEYWQMWRDYQMEFAFLEELLGEDL